eukprot:gene4004-2128_t
MLCLQETCHWSDDQLRWLAPAGAVVHTNSDRSRAPFRHTGTHGNPFGVVTIVRGVGTRRRAYDDRFVCTEQRTGGGRVAVLNVYAP